MLSNGGGVGATQARLRDSPVVGLPRPLARDLRIAFAVAAVTTIASVGPWVPVVSPGGAFVLPRSDCWEPLPPMVNRR